jgi:hypothetical protein
MTIRGVHFASFDPELWVVGLNEVAFNAPIPLPDVALETFSFRALSYGASAVSPQAEHDAGSLRNDGKCRIQIQHPHRQWPSYSTNPIRRQSRNSACRIVMRS